MYTKPDRFFLKSFFHHYFNFHSNEHYAYLPHLPFSEKQKEFWLYCRKISIPTLINDLKDALAKKYNFNFQLWDNGLKTDEVEKSVIFFEFATSLSQERIDKVKAKYAKLKKFLTLLGVFPVEKVYIIILHTDVCENLNQIKAPITIQTDAEKECSIVAGVAFEGQVLTNKAIKEMNKVLANLVENEINKMFPDHKAVPGR